MLDSTVVQELFQSLGFSYSLIRHYGDLLWKAFNETIDLKKTRQVWLQILVFDLSRGISAEIQPIL